MFELNDGAHPRAQRSSDAFDPECLTRQPYLWMHPRFRSRVQQLSGWPAPEQYDELAAQVPHGPHTTLPCFVRQSRAAVVGAGGYECHVAQRRAVPTRPGSWHDFFNMAVWAHFPELRWALNSLHVEADVEERDPRNGRSPAQNLAASFDETGMIVVSRSRPLLEGLRALQFKRVFWEQRRELSESTRFWIVGHGLLESLLKPHPRLVARSLLLHVPDEVRSMDHELMLRCDGRVAARVRDWRRARNVLDPIPVCAIPDFADNASADFYADPQRLPFEPISRRPASSEFLAS